VHRDFFFEKALSFPPSGLGATAEILRDGSEKMTVCLVNDMETLIGGEPSVSRTACALARAVSPETPDSMVFDLIRAIRQTFWIVPAWR